MKLASPCISVCTMDEATGWCRGCYRTLSEITRWGSSDVTEQQAILAKLPWRHGQAGFAQAQRNPFFAASKRENQP